MRLSTTAALAALGLLAACARAPAEGEAVGACPWRPAPEVLFRRDRDPADAPFSNEDLARDFERAVFFSEFHTNDGRVVRGEREGVLARWETPIRYRLGGDAVAAHEPPRFREIAARLSAATGLEISEADAWDQPDLLITIASRAARLRGAEALEAARGPETEGLIYRLRETDPETICTASAAFDLESQEIIQGAIIIRGEVSDAVREICAEEEFAQILGPANDDPCARPSIFNDDAEFSLLTAHDELILRVLYDPRLRPGMTREEAMPIARRIIAELRPEE